MPNRQIAEVYPPGEFIKEELEARGWSQIELAEIIARPPRVVSEVISAKRSITPETAKELGEAFGTGAQFWMNLETSYQIGRSKDIDDGVARRAKLYELAPIKGMIKRCWLEPSSNVAILEKQILEFFEIKSLDEPPKFEKHAARKSTSYSTITPSQTAWLFRAKQISSAMKVKIFSMEALDGALRRLKRLLSHPNEIRHIPHILAEAGVRFLIMEPLPQTRIDGASFWLNNKFPVVVVSLRYDRIDYFWFTLMHELAHIKNGDSLNKDSFNLDVELVGGSDNEVQINLARERKANQFATDFIFDKAEIENFVNINSPSYSLTKIKHFARQLDVHPALVIGQLQHRKEISYGFHRKLLEKVKHIIIETSTTDGWGIVP